MSKAKMAKLRRVKRSSKPQGLDSRFVYGCVRGADGVLVKTLCPKWPLVVASDCTGMATEIIALNRIGLPVEHTFACESDSIARRLLQHNYPSLKFYDDANNLAKLCHRAKVDLYVAALPRS